MKELKLNKGFVVWVDDEDVELVTSGRLRWRAAKFKKQGRTYAAENRTGAFMHRMIMGAKGHQQVDHRHHLDHLGIIDNRRQNLRFATPTQNQANQPKGTSNRKGGSTSVFKGVSWDRERGKWVSQCGKFLGRFSREADAAYVYDLAAVSKYGEFAFTNFPVVGSQAWVFGEQPCG